MQLSWEETDITSTLNFIGFLSRRPRCINDLLAPLVLPFMIWFRRIYWTLTIMALKLIPSISYLPLIAMYVVTWDLLSNMHPASRAFLSLARFWRSRERLCMNRVRSLWNMRCMLPGYSLEPKLNMPDLAAILVFHGTAGSIITIGFVAKRTLALEKPV